MHACANRENVNALRPVYMLLNHLLIQFTQVVIGVCVLFGERVNSEAGLTFNTAKIQRYFFYKMYCLYNRNGTTFVSRR